MTQIKWLTKSQAWKLAEKLASLPAFGSIEKVAESIGAHHTTVYRWKDGGNALPDAKLTIPLKELAIKHGIIKAAA
jgi:hypothetical protein